MANDNTVDNINSELQKCIVDADVAILETEIEELHYKNQDLINERSAYKDVINSQNARINQLIDILEVVTKKLSNK